VGLGSNSTWQNYWQIVWIIVGPEAKAEMEIEDGKIHRLQVFWE